MWSEYWEGAEGVKEEEVGGRGEEGGGEKGLGGERGREGERGDDEGETGKRKENPNRGRGVEMITRL